MPGSAIAQNLPPSTEEQLLRRWLSAAESQICALEVLCSQIPKTNMLLEENMVAVGEAFGRLAEEVRRQPESAARERMMQDVRQAIIGMQFQDRVSQNLVIAQKVTRAIVDYLNGVIGETIAGLKLEGKATLDTGFAGQMAELLTLGELQHQFVDHLITHGYIRDGSQIGAVTSGAAASQSGEAELF